MEVWAKPIADSAIISRMARDIVRFMGVSCCRSV
jgi:hypothetical protein